jgi:NADH dehydrogenase FAD-containing subunit
MRHGVIVGGGFAGLNCVHKLASRPDVRELDRKSAGRARS